MQKQLSEQLLLSQTLNRIAKNHVTLLSKFIFILEKIVVLYKIY